MSERSARADRLWDDMVRRHVAVADTRAPTSAPPDHRPDAAVLACSDARVPPSLLFGEEPGSLFVVRLAGNSATPGAIASLAYAVEALGTELVVVLGHTGCGAVTAALQHDPADALAPTLGPILTPIDEMLDACATCHDIDLAVTANVRHNVDRLTRDRGPLGAAIRAGRVVVHGAVHDIATGRLREVALDHQPDPHHPELTRSSP